MLAFRNQFGIPRIMRWAPPDETIRWFIVPCPTQKGFFLFTNGSAPNFLMEDVPADYVFVTPHLVQSVVAHRWGACKLRCAPHACVLHASGCLHSTCHPDQAPCPWAPLHPLVKSVTDGTGERRRTATFWGLSYSHKATAA